MTTQDIIDHLKAGRPLTAKVVKEIVGELERVKALEEALKEIAWSDECASLVAKEALEATCQK